ncbi:restriction endonuclease subunit S [Roseovarius mucosus]|uniref:restriction endonuclease subunit S n=1 Tax=Roseovarius mucosus TaxID=215743 RepID=UPI003BA9C984
MKDAPLTAARLLALYDRVADSEDAIPRLRRFVLDLAVRGKLVAQDAGDEPAAELLKRIAKEKARLVKAGEVSKEKSPAPLPVADLPFELPHGWAWTRLGSLSQFVTSGSRDWAKHYSSEGAIFVRMGNLSKDHYRLRLDHIQRVKPPSDGEGTRTRLEAGDILISITGDVGMLGLVPEGFGEAYINQHTAMVRPMPELKGRYLAEIFRSPFAQKQFNEPQRGIKNSFRLTDVTQLVVPLPPLAEQRRIVGRVEELMALCDQLQAARAEERAVRDRLTTATLSRLTDPDQSVEAAPQNARFALQTLPTLTTHPDQIKPLRQTILNLAIRGKLVEQDPTDEPAAELLKRIGKEVAAKRKEMGLRPQDKLPAVDPSEAPFELPTCWAWARFPEVGVFARGKSKHRPRNDQSLYTDGTVPFVQTGDVARSAGVITTHSSVYNENGLRQSMLWPAGTMCITIAANIADSGILTFDACFPDSVVGLVAASPFENARFFEYFVRTAKANLTEFAPATAQKNINLGILEMVLIPLPPLAEQHRIVARVDALMALCDQLESSLTTTTTTRSRLLEALLHEALDGVLGVQSEAAA